MSKASEWTQKALAARAELARVEAARPPTYELRTRRFVVTDTGKLCIHWDNTEHGHQVFDELEARELSDWLRETFD